MRDCLLIVAGCGHARRSADELYDYDRTLYLRQTHYALSNLRYKCDVVLVSNGGPREYTSYFSTLDRYYGIMERPNVGMSHGAYNDAWRANPGYKYYVMIEDDYQFVMDDFDQIMVGMMEERPELGMLCSVVDYRGALPFPGHQNGIISDACLRQMGGINVVGIDGYPTADQSQINWGTSLNSTQYGLDDMGRSFRAPFWSPHVAPPVAADPSVQIPYEDGVWMHYPDAPQTLLVPSQMYRKLHPCSSTF